MFLKLLSAFYVNGTSISFSIGSRKISETFLQIFETKCKSLIDLEACNVMEGNVFKLVTKHSVHIKEGKQFFIIDGIVNCNRCYIYVHRLKHKLLLAQYGGAKSNIGVQDVPKPRVLSSPSQAQSDTRQQVQVTSAQNNALLGTDIAPQISGQESTEQR
jgi:hypothetical protein